MSSFETPIVTDPLGYVYRPSGSVWTFTGQSGLTKNGTAFTWANPNAPAQNQVLFLQNQGYVETTFNFQSNGYYRFLFKAAWREGCCEQPKYIRVLVDGVVVNGVTVNDFEVGEVELRSKNYEQYFTLPVELTSGNHTIRLEGDNPTVWGDYTGFVDDFRIQKLPEMPNYLGWTVPDGSTYAIGSANYNFSTLNVEGTLVAPQNHDVSITSNYILVKENGRFQIGQELSPYQQEATITLNSGGSQVMHMGTKFLGARNNGVIELHGKEKVSWTKLRETVNPGGGTIKLAEAVNWEVGDEIVIAPSRAPGRTPSGGEDDSFANEYEKRTITSITNGNKDLTLNSGVTYRHTGVTKSYSGNGQTWTADIRAEVGLLTRNIKIQGDAASSDPNDINQYQKGAHVMIMRTADDKLNMKKPAAYFNGVELYRMGRNQELGRYPFHWHEMDDVDGQYFKNSSVHLSYNRALTIHRTNNSLVENSVFFDHIGHGIFFEEGNEEGHKILGNLVIGSKRPLPGEQMSSHADDGETLNVWQNRGPASYWITHPNNTIEGNVAAGTVGTGFWYIFPRWDTGGQNKEPQKAPFGSFKNNVAHSTSSGFDIFDELGLMDWSTNIFYPHSVHANIGYLSTSVYEILNCTWYANRVGVYTGTDQNRYHPDEYGREIYAPNDHLIFKNNIFADNEKAVMLASDNQIKNSIFVDDTGEGNAPPNGRSLAFVYDGAGKISNSHIVGYNTPNSGSSTISFAGAAFTYGNFRFKDVTNTGSNVVFDGTSGLGSANKRNVTIYDEDGSLTGYSGSTLIVANNSSSAENQFKLLGGEVTPTGWTNMMRSSRRYCITRLRVHIGAQPFYGWVPKVDVVRTKGTNTVTIPTDPIGRTPTLPFIMNDQDLLYTYDWVYGSGQGIGDVMPGATNAAHRILQFKLANAAQSGDFVIVRFKDMAKLPGLSVNMNYEQRVSDIHPSQTGLAVFQEISLAGLKNSNISAYYMDQNDLYIKAISNGEFAQYFNIRWLGLPLGGVANNTETLGGEKSLIDNKHVVYPNPASDKLYIKGLKAGAEVQVVDLSGRLMQTSTYHSYLDISQIKSGMYVVRTENGNFKFKKQ